MLPEVKVDMEEKYQYLRRMKKRYVKANRKELESPALLEFEF